MDKNKRMFTIETDSDVKIIAANTHSVLFKVRQETFLINQSEFGIVVYRRTDLDDFTLAKSSSDEVVNQVAGSVSFTKIAQNSNKVNLIRILDELMLFSTHRHYEVAKMRNFVGANESVIREMEKNNQRVKESYLGTSLVKRLGVPAYRVQD